MNVEAVREDRTGKAADIASISPPVEPCPMGETTTIDAALARGGDTAETILRRADRLLCENRGGGETGFPCPLERRGMDDFPSDEDPIVIPIDDFLDLHAFRPGDVKDLLDDYLEEAWKRGFREVRIIHGKGMGMLRARVRGILAKHPLVVNYREADAGDGGWGATVAALKEKSTD